jgi:hypothetical protein
MPLNYGTLKAQILEDTHRPDLAGKVDDFVRVAEGVIFRRLRCAEMVARLDLTDADRITADEGFFALPSNYLEERSFFLNGSGGCFLESVSLAELRAYAASAPVRHYCVISDGEVEFRGVPSDTATIELIYFARPAALTDDADVNDILTRHETIYLDAGKSALYAFTQDGELASAHADAAVSAIEALNEQAGRMLGGARTNRGYDLSSWGAR